MSRWEPNAPGRLREAAFALYTEQGYDETTVAEIAERAGLTERTFFRHFADKREVLFAGSEGFSSAFVQAIDAAPISDPLLSVVAAAVEAAGAAFPPVEMVGRRRALILANPELLERELIKLYSTANAIAEALRRRGTPDAAAVLAAQTGLSALQVAMDRWIDDPAGRPWEFHVREAMDAARSLADDPRLAVRS